MAPLAVTPELLERHGLTTADLEAVQRILGRVPTLVELGIFSVMWSEHCSYKSSKHWLGRLPTEAPWVICGPGENAGVVDIGDGMVGGLQDREPQPPELHRAATRARRPGVGGILRDVFTMGARPVALLNALRFGAPDHPKTRHLVAGVVAGIGGYGNCIGVPTVGGETTFHRAYQRQHPGQRHVRRPGRRGTRSSMPRAAGVGNPVVYVGAKTGRDGIHGATMASAEFNRGDRGQAADGPGGRSRSPRSCCSRPAWS